ncbi:MAG: transcriptional regulator, partial [Treponema sp.]|nr:transcriptional regulator [Treponema sp.]
GAGGGTIINAHGTGKEEDAKFFGVTIVPEKEMLMILVDKGKAAPVVEAIRALPCLAQPGSGIAFCTEVSDFTLLGRKK